MDDSQDAAAVRSGIGTSAGTLSGPSPDWPSAPLGGAGDHRASIDAGRGGGIIGAVVAVLRGWRQRAGQRRCMARMNDHLLRDVGIARAEACREAVKPFWRP